MSAVDELIIQLHDRDRERRLAASLSLFARVQAGKIEAPARERDVNSHIHTKYSFSPYYPAEAVFRAWSAGLSTAGIVDHDSVAGAEEFMEAAKIFSLPAVSGFEVRTDLNDTPLAGLWFSNPDEIGNAYVTVQGLPHNKYGEINAALAPYRRARYERAQKIADNISALFARYDIPYSFEGDVLPLTLYNEGGTITERYMLYAAAEAVIKKTGKGERALDFCTRELSLNAPPSVAKKLMDGDSPYYTYDLLGLFKSELLPAVYVPGGEDCPPLSLLCETAKSMGGILTYCYLGDQAASVTGDKRAAKYEDDHLPYIIENLRALGFRGIAYMPSRNTDAQVARLKELCAKYSMLEICGEDINQPRQKFICEKMRAPLYADAYACTMALFAHEYLVSELGAEAGLFADESESLASRIARFSKLGCEMARENVDNNLI